MTARERQTAAMGPDPRLAETVRASCRLGLQEEG